MLAEFFTPPTGFEEPYADESEWIYSSHRGHNFVRVIGVLYDQGGVRDQDKILTVNVVIRPGYGSNDQYRDGKISARSRKDFDRNYIPRPPLRWVKDMAYRLIKGDGMGERTWVVVHLYGDGSALLVPAFGGVKAQAVGPDERHYWTEEPGGGTGFETAYEEG